MRPGGTTATGMKPNTIKTTTGIVATGTIVIDATITATMIATATGIVTTIVTTTDIVRTAGIELGEYGPNMWSGRRSAPLLVNIHKFLAGGANVHRPSCRPQSLN